MEANKSEIKRWSKRIWYPEIKYKGKAENDYVKDMLNATEMQSICFEDKEDLYKFLDFGITSGNLRNNDISFIRGDIFDIYIVTDYRYVDDCYKYIKELIKDSLGDGRNKWIVCDTLDTEFDYNAAGYLLAKLRALNCKGILYHMSEDASMNNFFECTSKKKVCKTIFIQKGSIDNPPEKEKED